MRTLNRLVGALGAVSLLLVAAQETRAEDTLKLAAGQRGNWDTSVSELGQSPRFPSSDSAPASSRSTG
jgi:NitT/TauT family transport system substrate-binding protein